MVEILQENLIEEHLRLLDLLEELVYSYGDKRSRHSFSRFVSGMHGWETNEHIEQALTFLNGFGLVNNYEVIDEDQAIFNVDVDALILSWYTKHYNDIKKLKETYDKDNNIEDCIILINKIFRLEGSPHCPACCRDKSDGELCEL